MKNIFLASFGLLFLLAGCQTVQPSYTDTRHGYENAKLRLPDRAAQNVREVVRRDYTSIFYETYYFDNFANFTITHGHADKPSFEPSIKTFKRHLKRELPSHLRVIALQQPVQSRNGIHSISFPERQGRRCIYAYKGVGSFVNLAGGHVFTKGYAFFQGCDEIKTIEDLNIPEIIAQTNLKSQD